MVVADINAEAAVSVAAGIMERGGHALAVTVDVADEQQAQALVAAAVDRFGGRIDVLQQRGADGSGAHAGRRRGHGAIGRALGQNARGESTRNDALLQARDSVMLSNGGGSIINTSSRGGSAGDLRGTAYGVSKAGVDM